MSNTVTSRDIISLDRAIDELITRQSYVSEMNITALCAYDIAIQAIKSQIEQENPKPLTLDELKDMQGEPVYCVDSKGNGKWAFVEDYDEVCIDSDYEDWEFYCYGWDNDDGWLAYRQKPEQALKEAGQ